MSAILDGQVGASGKAEIWAISRLTPNPSNPRGAVVEDAELLSLAESIRLHGLLQPLVVTPDGVIVAGHRRFAACQLLDLETVAVTVRSFTEQEQAEVMLVENLQRRDLSPLQAALGFKTLSENGLSVETIAERVGWGKDAVRKHLWILDLAPEVQSMYDSRELSIGFIPYLVEIESHERQTQVARQAIEEEWLINEMSRAVKIVASSRCRGSRNYRQKRTPKEDAQIAHVLRATRAVKRLSEKCTDDLFNERFYKAWLVDLADYLDDFNVQDRQSAAVEAWHKGCRSNKDFAQFLRLSIQEARELLASMERDGTFCKAKQGGKKATQRGSPPPPIWHLIGEPLGSDFSVVLNRPHIELGGDEGEDATLIEALLEDVEPAGLDAVT